MAQGQPLGKGPAATHGAPPTGPQQTAGVPADLEPDYDAVEPEEEFDHERLRAWLGERMGRDLPAMEVFQFRGGHSNLTYLLRFTGEEWVMRRPPFGPVPASAHDMTREYRVLSRLWKVYPPAPRAILLCEDNAVIGAPFYVMERRTGVVIRKREPLPQVLGDRPETFRRISHAFIDALADLHRVDYVAAGLGDLGRPAGFLERQIRGWMDRWNRAKAREVPLMGRVGAWLLENMPPAQAPAIIHNDFFLHNVMLDVRDPGKVVAVLDWEMATLGDPLVDLGTALGYWLEPTDPKELISRSDEPGHTLRAGFASRAELISRYSARTGRDVTQIAYYHAFAFWKTATVVEQLYSRFARGLTHDRRLARMEGESALLAAAAAGVAEKLGFHP